MAGVSSCMKYSMFVFNFLFWVCGCIILGVSIWIRVSKDAQEFFIGLLLILILQITAGILGAVYRSKIDVVVNQTLLETAKQLQSTEQQYQTFQMNFQKFEQENLCCGLMSGQQDWGTNFNTQALKACECSQSYEKTDFCVSFGRKYIYKKTCGTVIINYLKDHMIILMGIAFGLAVIEIVGLGLSMSLYCQISRK
ncbi:tetraspanin-8 isoform X2 [Alligator mississippiensis]|uniref:tetraspanin-8 isoform X2 n=1 Tax=Alligator mississippiensis TaxID=8496 RepID=UPI00071190FC|nr:tetraspanin-8 isoform X2 [Alligator mississippiensis]